MFGCCLPIRSNKQSFSANSVYVSQLFYGMPNVRCWNFWYYQDMKNKAIVVGASTVGKTTIVKHLKAITKLKIRESDDVLTELNGGAYPGDTNYKMNVLVPQMVKKVLHQHNIIFFTNTDYFSPEELKIARQNGFVIILLSLAKDKMSKRNKYREKIEGYEDHSKYFDDMLRYQQDILNKGLVDKVIDTDRPVEQIGEDILSNMEA